MNDIHDSIRDILRHIGEDPQREGLFETPDRVVASWDTIYGGYRVDVPSLFKTFEQDLGCEEGQPHGMVYLKDIEFYSTCEHHMLPFFGHAHIAYIPRCKVIGVSKLARILDAFARRLQIQERLAEQVTRALMDHLNPLGAACTIEAQHLCMTARGVQKQHSVMGYSSMRGVFLEDHATRAEFLALSRGAR